MSKTEACSDFDFAVFDCDGVVLDSNPVKVEAFRWALRDERPDLVDELVEYHRKNGGMTRHAKLKYFYDRLVGQPDEERMKRALADFATYCHRNLPNCQLVAGVCEFIAALRCPLFLVSGGDEREVRLLLRARGLLSAFQEVLGSPTPKGTHMDWLSRSNRFGGRGVYFGDALLDYELARKHGIEFVFVSGVSDWIGGVETCRAAGVRIVRDFLELRGETASAGYLAG